MTLHKEGNATIGLIGFLFLAISGLGYYFFFENMAWLFWFLFALSADLGLMAYSGVFVAAIILWFEHRIVLKDFTKIDRAFFTLNGYLGIIFFIFIFIDRF